MTDTHRDSDDTSRLVAAANENLKRAFAMLAAETAAGESREFGPLTATAAGVPAPLFNRVFVFDAPPIDELSAAVTWLAERDLPFWVTASDAAVDSVSAHRTDLDLVKATEQPGMAMAPLDELPPADSVATITEVTEPDDREAFTTVTTAAFDLPQAVAEPVDGAALAAADIRPFLGTVDGQPVATALLIRTGDVAGVYSVAVVEEFRRRGIGEAMTLAVLRAGRADGCEMGVLQSSEMAYPLYERLGFETVVTYHLFEPAV